MKKRNFLGLLLITLVLFSFSVFSHEEELEDTFRIDEYLTSTSITYVSIASSIIILLVLISIFHKNKSEKTKWFLFLGMFTPIILATLYSAGSTVYLNLISETGGPVHWHADFEIWNCGKKVDLIDPSGLSNRVGTPVLHEHGDDRIHVEGVVVRNQDVDLYNFFKVVGGSLTSNYLGLPTDNGVVEMQNGDMCNRKEGKLQVFVYRIVNAYPTQRTGFLYEQIKVDDPREYVLSPYINVPPGDCIIIEFDEGKNATKKVCETYEIAIQKGDMREAG